MQYALLAYNPHEDTDRAARPIAGPLATANRWRGPAPPHPSRLALGAQVAKAERWPGASRQAAVVVHIVMSRTLPNRRPGSPQALVSGGVDFVDRVGIPLNSLNCRAETTKWAVRV